jgi:GABA(A) receptor-associated protein
MSSTEKSFKESHSVEELKAEAQRIRTKYPDRVPIIVERGNDNVPAIDKKKFLVPCDLTVGQFMMVIRKRIKLNADSAIFLFINNTLPTSSALMSQIYEDHKDETGFLFITYSGESTFG